jgi:hypothetical protein
MRVSWCFIALTCVLVGAVLSGGCVMGSSPEPASLAPLQETRVISGDPVVGTWHWNMFDGSKTIFYTFSPDGGYSTSDSMNTGTEHGTWATAGENRYNVTVKGNIIVFVFQPETDTIAKANYPGTRFYPEGAGPAIITHEAKAPLETTVPTTQPTLDLLKELSGGTLSRENTDPAKIVKSAPTKTP